jgi:hypothetical protein
VTSGRTAFYSATWTNLGKSTLTNPIVMITLPAGSALASATSPTCTVAPASGSVVVSCPQQNLASGSTVTQHLLVKMPPAATITTVRAELTADEGGSDQNKSHLDTFRAPGQPVKIVDDAAVDAAGGCISNGDQALATAGGLSTANPLITTAALSGTSGAAPCVPVTVEESRATSPAEACGDGATCTTDVAVTESDFSEVSDRPLAPTVQLTFTVLANSKNLTWYKDGTAVTDCPGATDLPATVNACVNSRSKTGSSTVRLGVLWRAGPDPSWRG